MIHQSSDRVCVEGPNPAGHIPPAGTSTPPGTTTHGPFNPDGFYTVGVTDCGGSCTPVALFDAGDGCVNGTSGTLLAILEATDGTNSHNIKYTEANGITPHIVSPFAGVVELHAFGQGDLLVCSVEGTTFTNGICCPVPPPPF